MEVSGGGGGGKPIEGGGLSGNKLMIQSTNKVLNNFAISGFQMENKIVKRYIVRRKRIL